MSALGLGVPQTKIFLGAYFALAFYYVVFSRTSDQPNVIERALPPNYVAIYGLSLLVAILANTSVLKWYHVALYAIALEILGMLIKPKKSKDLGSRILGFRSMTSGWALVALIVYLRSQST